MTYEVHDHVIEVKVSLQSTSQIAMALYLFLTLSIIVMRNKVRRLVDVET
jgi:hypothetical protein